MQIHSLGNLYTSKNLKNNTLKCCIIHWLYLPYPQMSGCFPTSTHMFGFSASCAKVTENLAKLLG